MKSRMRENCTSGSVRGSRQSLHSRNIVKGVSRLSTRLINMCKVAIIDTGVNTEHEKLVTSNIQCYHIEYTPLNSITIAPGCSDTIGHGTAICGIIVSELPEVELIVFQVFDDYYEIEDERLICALEYIYNFCDVDIINMSIGCTMCQNRKKLANICDKLAQKGVVLVASYDNDGAISYPAAFKSVIGVDFDMSCKKKR